MASPSAVRSIAAIALGMVVLAGCGDDGDSTGPEEGVTVEDVMEEPGLDYDFDGDGQPDADEHLGEEVTVSGEVSAQVDDRVFHVAGEPGTAGLLVVSDEPIVDRLDSDDVVRVTGTVREVAPSTFERELGVPYDEDYDSFGGRHAVFATSVEVIGS